MKRKSKVGIDRMKETNTDEGGRRRVGGESSGGTRSWRKTERRKWREAEMRVKERSIGK